MKSCIIYGHRVIEQPGAVFGPDATNCVSAGDFERLLAFLARRNPEPDWAERFTRQLADPLPYELLTFDDGYNDLFTVSLPLIEKYQVPCVIFITTGFVDGELSDYESSLAAIISSSRALSCPRNGRISFTDDAARAKTYDRLRLDLKPLSRQARERYMIELLRLNPSVEVPRNSRFLDWEQVRELDRHPLVTIGAHSRSHIMLSRLNPLEVFSELISSRRRLETELGRKVDILAYPYGACSAQTRFLARRAGYRLGFGTHSGPINSNVNRMFIPRTDIHTYLENMPA
jgi:peptidoglycan/xylan/chitin deacetylase (PgdA/CDA1 family)